MTVIERAPAKINLGLKILGKRADGYHDILSLFQTVDLCDELALSDAEAPGFSCDVPTVPAGPENLVLKAELAFREAVGGGKPLRFTLRKRIPVGAGLGGGSSDAAAALRGLKRIYGDDTVTDDILASCAARLGSDVPFLLYGGTAVVSGRGERVTPMEWPFDFTYVIVYPGFSVSTAWAYDHVKRYSGDDCEYGAMVRNLSAGSLESGEFFCALSNDFEEVVFPAYPELTGIRSLLLSGVAAAALLTGSGSSLIGIFDDPDAASRCSDAFRERGLHAWAVKALPSAPEEE
jgi:4-diphosphocytidyl-2-C-methyl-D-erythritol kinase